MSSTTRPEELSGNLWRILGFMATFLIGVYSIYCGIFSDAISQSDQHPIFLPWAQFDYPTVDSIVSIESIASDAKKRTRLHLFTLDCSKSIASTKIPPWYRDVAEVLRKESYEIEIKNTPTAEDAIRMSLYFFLRELVTSNSTINPSDSAGIVDKFAVWAVCAEGRKIFPQIGTSIEATRENVDDAIRLIESGFSTPNKDRTNLTDLFRNVRSTYMGANSTQIDDSDMPNIILTVISDFKHDDGSSDVEKSRQELEREARSLSSERVMINMLVLPTGSDDEGMGVVFSFFEKNMEWYHLNRELITADIENRGNKFLFPVFVSREPITIYYDNPIDIDGKFILSSKGQGNIWLSLPLSSTDFGGERFILQYGPISTGQRVEGATMKGRLFSGGDSVRLKMDGKEGIVFHYQGPLPTFAASHVIKVSSSSSRHSYLIPIRFIKRLPEWAANWMFLVEIVFALIFVSVIMILLGIPLSTFFRRTIQDRA